MLILSPAFPKKAWPYHRSVVGFGVILFCAGGSRMAESQPRRTLKSTKQGDNVQNKTHGLSTAPNLKLFPEFCSFYCIVSKVADVWTPAKQTKTPSQSSKQKIKKTARAEDVPEDHRIPTRRSLGSVLRAWRVTITVAVTDSGCQAGR